MKNSESTIQNLKKVLAVNSQINSTLEIGSLLEIIMKTAAEVMQTEVASLLLMDFATQDLLFQVALGEKGGELKEKFRVKTGEGIAGSVAKTGQSLIVNDVSKDPRFAKRFDASTGFITKAILCVPMNARGKIIGVLQAINPLDSRTFTEDDQFLFETFADQAAIAVENARMHGEILKQERAKQELKIAAEIQQNFLPDLSQTKFNFEIAAATIPARDVGGDFYDVLALDSSRTGIVIGDVSGKGVPAALYMVRAITQYRFLAPRIPDAGKLLTELNHYLAQNSPFGMFVTLLYLIVDTQKKIVSYASAGHHAALKTSAKGVELLEAPSGPPAGLDEKTKYANQEASLQKENLLLLYTDGILEARNAKKEEFGIRRIEETLSGQKNSADAIHQIFEKIKTFASGVDQHDDMTLVAIKI